MMRTLLITNYWHPYNSPGALRWVKFLNEMDEKEIEFDVLTQRRPRKGFFDNTMPLPSNLGVIWEVFRFGKDWPAIIWGFLVLFKILFSKRYDRYLITSPPESLLFTAWFLEKIFKKKVLVDMRDYIDRPHQSHKWAVKLYSFFYRRLKYIIVAWQGIDKNRQVVYHGYDEIPMELNHSIPVCYDLGTVKRISYEKYNNLLSRRYFLSIDAPMGYPQSKYHTYKRYGFPVDPEMDKTERLGIDSWWFGGRKICRILKYQMGILLLFFLLSCNGKNYKVDVQLKTNKKIIDTTFSYSHLKRAPEINIYREFSVRDPLTDSLVCIPNFFQIHYCPSHSKYTWDHFIIGWDSLINYKVEEWE